MLAKHGLKQNDGTIPQHVVEGENAKFYVEHVERQSQNIAESHKQMADLLEKEANMKRLREHAEKLALENNPENFHHSNEVQKHQEPGSESDSGSDSEDETQPAPVLAAKKLPPKPAPAPAPKPTPKPAAAPQKQQQRSQSASSSGSSGSESGDSDLDEEEAEAEAASRSQRLSQ